MAKATTRGILALVLGIAVFSLQDVILKRLSGDYPLYQAMIIRSLAAVFGAGAHDGASHPSLAFLTRGWQVMPVRDLLLFMACGLIASTSLSLLTHAYRVGPSSSVAPFEYSLIIWGVLWGWACYGRSFPPRWPGPASPC